MNQAQANSLVGVLNTLDSLLAHKDETGVWIDGIDLFVNGDLVGHICYDAEQSEYTMMPHVANSWSAFVAIEPSWIWYGK